MKLSLLSSAANLAPPATLPIDPTRLFDFAPQGSVITYKLRVPDYPFQTDVDANVMAMMAGLPRERDLNALAVEAVKTLDIDAKQRAKALEYLTAYAAFLDNPDTVTDEKAMDNIITEARGIRSQVSSHYAPLKDLTVKVHTMQSGITLYRVKRFLAGWVSKDPKMFSAVYASGPDGQVSDATLALIPPLHVKLIGDMVLNLSALTEDQIKNLSWPGTSIPGRKISKAAKKRPTAPRGRSRATPSKPTHA